MSGRQRARREDRQPDPPPPPTYYYVLDRGDGLYHLVTPPLRGVTQPAACARAPRTTTGWALMVNARPLDRPVCAGCALAVRSSPPASAGTDTATR